jgi:hypothetical protein
LEQNGHVKTVMVSEDDPEAVIIAKAHDAFEIEPRMNGSSLRSYGGFDILYHLTGDHKGVPGRLHRDRGKRISYQSLQQ